MTLYAYPFPINGIYTFSRASTARYHTSGGLVASVASDALRDAHYEGGVRYVLVEPAATNAHGYSDGTMNVAGAGGVGANEGTFALDATVTDPLGTNAAGKFTETANVGEHGTFKGSLGTLRNNSDHCFSMYVKPAGRTWLGIATVTKGNSRKRSYFNMSTGAFGTTAAEHTVVSQVLTNGWVRFGVGYNIASGATGPVCEMYTTTGDGVLPGTVTGIAAISHYAWGLQWEQETLSATSLIPTSGGTPASRAADLLSFALTPTADVSAGGWTTDTGATTGLYAAVDDGPTAVDTDYIQSSTSPDADRAKFTLTSAPRPLDRAKVWTLVVRHKKTT